MSQSVLSVCGAARQTGVDRAIAVSMAEEGANVVMFLASSKSDYMTGQAINAAGGRQMN